MPSHSTHSHILTLLSLMSKLRMWLFCAYIHEQSLNPMYLQIKENIKKKHFRHRRKIAVLEQLAQQDPRSLEEQHPSPIPLLEQAQSTSAKWTVSGFKGYWIQKLGSDLGKQTHFSYPLKQIPVLKSLSWKEHHCSCSKAQNKIIFILIRIFQFPSCYSVNNTGKGLFL